MMRSILLSVGVVYFKTDLAQLHKICSTPPPQSVVHGTQDSIFDRDSVVSCSFAAAARVLLYY